MKKQQNARPNPVGILAVAGVLVGLGLLAGVDRAQAITITKQDVKNTTGSKSNNQRLYIYGVPPVVLKNRTTSYSTKVFTDTKAGAYPDAAGTTTEGKLYFSNLLAAFLNGEYATTSVSTVDPSVSLSLSSWSWYAGATRLGSVPDPSLYRRLGPFSRQPGGGTTNDWISLNITLANTVKPRNHQGDASDPNAQPQFMGDLPRPKSVLSYMDFGAAMVLPDKTRAQQIQIEQDLSQGSVARIAPGSQGVLPPPDNLLRSWPLLAGGQSCASETSVTNFVPPVVLAAGAQPPVPTTTAPVKAFVLAARAGDDGVNPLDTTSADAPRTMGQAGQLARVTLHPGATLTIQVRVLLAAFQANAGQPFKPLFLTRMREVTVVNDVEETRVLFSASADYPRFVSIQAAAGPALTGNITADGYANPGPVPAWGPKDRQQWAHALSLYNRSLRVYKRSGDEKLRNGSF